MATKAEVIKEAGVELRLITRSEDLDADQAAELGAAFDQVFAEQRRNGPITWMADNTPQWAVAALGFLVAVRAAGKYYSGQEYQAFVAKGSAALRSLKSMAADMAARDKIIRQKDF